ncbi:putative quinol monooxygenase [Streptomyces sp. NPDC047000]|uniref:putative quinol monooxygenase n=1 Tax=Streptomyces sp. NPDC047000 TaxID=3155474 RepID=UPI003402C32F
MTYGLVTKFLALPGERNALADCLLTAARQLAADPGCVHYVVATSAEPEAVWVTEVWTDRAAHDASLDSPQARAFIEQGRRLIAGVAEQTPLAVLGGVGLPD